MAIQAEIEVRVVTSDGDAKVEQLGNKIEDLGEKGENAGDKVSKGISKSNPVVQELDRRTKGAASGFIDMAKKARTAGIVIRGALLATGIGAFIVALGTVAAFWDEIKGFVTGVNIEMERTIKLQEQQELAQQHSLDLLNASENTLKLQGKTQKEINKLKIDEINSLIEIQTRELATQKARLQNLKDIQEGGGAGLEAFFRLSNKLLVNFARTIDNVFAKLGIDTGLAQTTFSAGDTLIETIFGSKEDITETEARIRELELSLASLANTSAGITLSERVGPQAREKQRVAGSGLSQGESTEIQAARDELEQLAQLDTEYLEDKFNKEQEGAAKKIELERRTNEIIKNLQSQFASDTINSLLSLAKRGSDLSKGFAIANVVREQIEAVSRIVSNLGVANAKAIAASPTTLGQPWVTLNTIGAGLSIGASIAGATRAIQDITSEKKTPSGGGVSSSSAGGGRTAPQFNLVEGTDSNQILQTLREDTQPVQAFVVGRNVTTQQEMDRNIIETSRI